MVKIFVLAAALLIGLVALACGDDGNGGDSTPATADASPTPEVAEPTGTEPSAATSTQAPPATNTPVPTGTPVVPDDPAPDPRVDCSPSYPTVCIPPYPPDLNCGDITFRRFTVLPPDPHGFDGDNDGVGCESG